MADAYCLEDFEAGQSRHSAAQTRGPRNDSPLQPARFRFEELAARLKRDTSGHARERLEHIVDTLGPDVTANQLQEAASQVLSIARQVREVTQSELGQLAEQVERFRADVERESRRQQEREFIDDRANDTIRVTNQVIGHLRRESDDFERRSLSKLTDLVVGYAQAKRNELLSKSSSASGAVVIRCDTTELCQLIHVILLQHIGDTHRDLRAAERHGAEYLCTLMNDVLMDGAAVIHEPGLLDARNAASSLLSGKQLSVRTDGRGWRWWRRRTSVGEAASVLETMIRREYLPIIEKLVTTNRAEFDLMIAASISKLSASSSQVLEALDSRRRRLGPPPPMARIGAPADTGDHTRLVSAGSMPDYTLLKIRIEMARNRQDRVSRLQKEFEHLSGGLQRPLAG